MTEAGATGEHRPDGADGPAEPGRLRIQPAQGGKRRRFRIGAAFALFLGATLAAALILASPVWHAPFRLRVTTSFVGLTAAADLRLDLRSSDWSLGPASPADAHQTGASSPATSPALTSLSRTASPKDAAHPDRIVLFLRAGEDLVLRRLAEKPAQYVLQLPSKSVPLTVQLGADVRITQTDAGGSASTLDASLSPLKFNFGGIADAQIRFTPFEGKEGIGDRLMVSRIGFGLPTQKGVEAGITGGELHFLDKPEHELALYRGTDLRLGELDAEVAAVLMGSEGIEVFASGTTQDAQLFVATRANADRHRSVMPTRYDWLKGAPVAAVGLGFLGALVALLGLVLALAQTFPAVGKWLHRFLKG